MLGDYVKIRITTPLDFSEEGSLNCGYIISHRSRIHQRAAVLGIDHPISSFYGKVTAVIKRKGRPVLWLIASKKSRLIINDIKPMIKNYIDESCEVDCLYERSCGAVVYRQAETGTRFLLIKNSGSSNWSFPKGHVENGETEEETAKREVFEETGAKITIIPGFIAKSEYKIKNSVEKDVFFFLARAEDSKVRIQPEEIDDYAWVEYPKAISVLKFENDRNILEKAYKFMLKHKDVQTDD